MYVPTVAQEIFNSIQFYSLFLTPHPLFLFFFPSYTLSPQERTMRREQLKADLEDLISCHDDPQSDDEDFLRQVDYNPRSMSRFIAQFHWERRDDERNLQESQGFLLP